MGVISTEVQTYIEATGNVQPEIDGSSKIYPYLSGTVTRIFNTVGEKVKKGDPLVTISSPEVTDTYASYLSSLSQLKQAERLYGLNKELFEIGAITKSDLLNSESAVKQLSAVAMGLKTKLTLYGLTKDVLDNKQTLSDSIVIRAPLNGYVAEIQTHLGDRVDPSTLLMNLADPQKICVVANIYDSDLPKIKKGSEVTFQIDTFPELILKGIVTYISLISDQESKTVKTYIRVLDHRDFLKQNMFVKIKIEGEKKALPTIPQSAMVYRDGKFFIYYPTGKQDQYELKEIKPIREVPGKMMAVEGLKVSEKIVLSAIEQEKP
ncbi:MAG TPA: efflux RND transporter periplasmic adaptor subunit [Thermodesulfobacteriota bacterium]|nr:efflux RND transporter periplasmic adaptor subunit [Thermodesulfobacteriota bacterium]